MKWTLAPIPASASAAITSPRSSVSRPARGGRRTGARRATRRARRRAARGGPRPSTPRTRPVRLGDRPPRGEQLLGTLELDQAERRGEIGHVVLVARVLDLVVPRAAGGVPLPGVAADPVERHQADAIRDGIVVGHEHAALAGRDRLGRVEGVGAHPADRPRVAAVRARRSGSGTRAPRPPRPGSRAARAASTRRSISTGRPATWTAIDRAGPRRDRGEHGLGRDVERASIDVDEDRRRTAIDDDLRARRERPRRHDHLVAGSHAERLEGEVQGCRRRVERDRVARSRPPRRTAASNCFARGPVVSQPDSRTSSTAASRDR